jgi:hypothetical protein
MDYEIYESLSINNNLYAFRFALNCEKIIKAIKSISNVTPLVRIVNRRRYSNYFVIEREVKFSLRTDMLY